jgi:hypothetical protein
MIVVSVLRRQVRKFPVVSPINGLEKNYRWSFLAVNLFEGLKMVARTLPIASGDKPFPTSCLVSSFFIRFHA